MRTSAKLNLFFGVRNLSEEFLPVHLAYLESFFRRRRINAFFFFAVAGASACLGLLVLGAKDAMSTAPQAVGYALVATMLALAILEHLLLVLPLDTTALWRWAIRKRGCSQASVLPVIATHPASVVVGDTLDQHDTIFQVR
jgi:putative photosynthetic complex assembly protein 2